MSIRLIAALVCEQVTKTPDSDRVSIDGIIWEMRRALPVTFEVAFIFIICGIRGTHDCQVVVLDGDTRDTVLELADEKIICPSSQTRLIITDRCVLHAREEGEFVFCLAVDGEIAAETAPLRIFGI